MKYKQLPSVTQIQKLLATAFENPEANREVYNWCEETLKHIRFLENERVKLVQKYGKENENGTFSVSEENKQKFFSEFKKILEMDIDAQIKECPVKLYWFDNDKCSYPKEKDLWLTPADIAKILACK